MKRGLIAGVFAALIGSVLPQERLWLGRDDGVFVGITTIPAEFALPSYDVKEMAVFQIGGPARVACLDVVFGGKQGRAVVHFWKDIGSTFYPYLPFRYFEWDHCAPIEVDVPADTLGQWMSFDLSALGRNLVLEHEQKLIVGLFVKPDQPHFGCDAQNSDETASVVELSDPKAKGSQPMRIYKAAGDFMIRLNVEPLPEPKPKLFEDATERLGLKGIAARAFAWADVDGDGWEDLLVDGSRLFHNDKGTGFLEITEPSGLAGGHFTFGLFADADNDGHIDLFRAAMNRKDECGLWLNDGRGAYHPAPRSGLSGRFFSYAGSWLDYDGDGHVDLFLANGWDLEKDESRDPSRLWRNLGNGRFADVTESSGLERSGAPTLFSRAATSGDLDRDGRPELVVGAFRLGPVRLWTFAGGHATDIAPTLGMAGGPTRRGTPGFGQALGINIVDYDDDGRPDVFIANLMHPDWRGYQGSNESWMYRNEGAEDMKFRRQPASSIGLDYQETPTDPTFGDFDNDGAVDVFWNSMYHTARFFRQEGEGRFVDRTLSSGLAAAQAMPSAACDFDRDGRLDLVVNDARRGLILYRNIGPAGNWLEVRLHATRSNRAAIGAIVRAFSGQDVRTRLVTSGKGMGNQDSLILHFGWPEAKSIDRLEIRWPSGGTQIIAAPKPRQILDVTERTKRRWRPRLSPPK